MIPRIRFGCGGGLCFGWLLASVDCPAAFVVVLVGVFELGCGWPVVCGWVAAFCGVGAKGKAAMSIRALEFEACEQRDAGRQRSEIEVK
jgi:hypothetical protein